jgi:hypothetical protein
MITISRNAALILIRKLIEPYSEKYLSDPPETTSEIEILNGCKWWLERDAEVDHRELDEESRSFAKKWAHLDKCKSLEEVPDEFLKELLSVYDHIEDYVDDYDQAFNNLCWLLNARQV